MNSKTITHKKNRLIAGIILFILLFSGNFFFPKHNFIPAKDNVTVSRLRICHLQNPIGIDENNPTFSWIMEATNRGSFQSAYCIQLADSKENLNHGNYLWDSGKISSSLSVGIPYNGGTLKPKTRYYWQVTIWNEDNKSFTSTEEAFFETGLMGNNMSEAKWISAPDISVTEAVPDEAYTYSIHYDMNISNTSACFVFGADKGRYGSMYLCRIRDNGSEAFFGLQKAEHGYISDSFKEVQIDTAGQTETSKYTVDLQIDHTNMYVTINGTRLPAFLIENTPVAAIGYYKSRGVSHAYLDNLLVQDASGKILYQDNFESAKNIFTPYHTFMEKGSLKIGSGMILTKYHEDPAPLFYKEFKLQNKSIADARIYMTALGSFSLICNGQQVSDEYFAPGKLAYNRELTYVTYDVTQLLNQGQGNALGITLLHGWYDRAVGYPEIWNSWGSKNALLGMLEIHYQDGTTETIVTDESFLCSLDSPIRENDIYQGEFYDASFKQEGFGCVGFLCKGWLPAEVNSVDDIYFTIPLKGKENESIRCVAELTPVSVSEPRENVYVYDFGQNFAGTCRIKVTGDAGQILTLRYGEALNNENMDNCDDFAGTIWTENLSTAEATDYYILKGDIQGETFEPKYTYHGFRYLQITGLSEPLPLEDVQGIVLSSDLEQTGTFECSNEILNQFYKNTLWSQRSNFMDNPTDCPQRDERHGWAGDAQIYSLAASYHMNTYNFYKKYLDDLKLLQAEDGSFSDMAPRNFTTNPDGTNGNGGNNCWGDAAMVITWNLYTQYGDKRIIEENYEALCKWIDILIQTSDNYIRNQGGYGDHLSWEDTPSDLSDTAWCAHSADLLSKMAVVLNRQEDADHYRNIYENYKKAWQDSYVQADGITVCDTQTSYALGLAFNLFPPELEKSAADRLNTLAEYSGHHIHTGYSGVGYLLPSLSEHGLVDTAYSFLLQEEYPSLLYPVKHNATTTYEQYSGYVENENGTFHLEGSLNHYAFGTPVSWLYTDILGIKSDENDPGYHHILITPETGGNLTYAKGSYESIYGTILVAWEQTAGGYNFNIKIPANTTATITLPAPPKGQTYFESGKPFKNTKTAVSLNCDNEKIQFEAGSGSYCFTLEPAINAWCSAYGRSSISNNRRQHFELPSHPYPSCLLS